MLYQYKAKNQKGAIKLGELEAENPQGVYSILRKEGFFVISVSQSKAKQEFFSFLNRVSLKDLAIFTKELQVMIKAGLSISAALKAQAEETDNKKLANIASKLEQTVSGGTALSKAMSQFSDVFSPVYVSTVKSGEASGKLEEVLGSLATQLQKDYDLQAKIKSAMTYPAFILVALFGIILIIFIYVIPSLTSLFKELGGSLPFTTQILIGISNFLVKAWWLVILFSVAFFVFIRYYKKTPAGKKFFDILKIKLPLFGKLTRKIYIAKFCRTSSTLIKAGLPILGVLKNTKEVIPNSIYQEEIARAEKKVENGVSLSRALKDSSYFPKMVCHLISVGETSGKVEDSLDTLGDYFEKEIAVTTDALASLVEPFLIVIMGIGVAFVVISVIKPIYSLAQII